MSEQSLKEVAIALFWASISHFEDDTARESLQLLRDMLDTRAIRDPAARDVLSTIIRNSRLPAQSC